MIGEVVYDIAREFEITLVSLYLPVGRDRLAMVGVAGYPAPFTEIEIGRGIIGRAAATRQTQFVPNVLADPDYLAARDDVLSEVAAPIVHGDELLGVVNFEGTAARPIGTAQVALAEMVVHSLSAALRSARLDDGDADASTRSSACSGSAVRWSPTSIARGSSDRSPMSWRTCSMRMWWHCSPVGPMGCFGSRRVSAFRVMRSVWRHRLAWGSSSDASAAEYASMGSPTSMPGRPGSSRANPAMLRRTPRWRLPIVVGEMVAAVMVVTRAGVDRDYSELECGWPIC